jgi:ATP-dependent RNA helicase SUPV3L1/SUV3
MTSLTGASGEDFASILRSLGYRMERRPKPVEPVAPRGDAAAAESAATSGDGATMESAPAEAVAPASDAPALLPEAELLPAAEAPPTEPAMSAPEEVSVPVIEQAGTPAAGQRTSLGISPSDVTAEGAMRAAALSAEAAFIEVWRPGRPSDRHPRHEKARRPHRGTGRERPRSAEALPTATPAQAEATPSQPAEAPPRAHKPHLPRPPRPQRQDRSNRQERPHRPDREGGRPAFAKLRSAPERREKPADPNSPFAKLAALKAQLEANAKERH